MRRFEFTSKVTLNESVRVETYQIFNESVSVTDQAVKDAIDISSDADISKVEINSVQIIITPQSGNRVKVLSFGANIVFEGLVIPILKNQGFDVKIPDSPGEEVVLTDIETDAVLQLKRIINNYLSNINSNPFILNVVGETAFVLHDYINLGINFKIEFSTVYEECVEVYFGGDDCE